MCFFTSNGYNNYNLWSFKKSVIKILNIKEEVGVDELTLLRSVCALLDQQNIALSPQQVVAIHRIPGKSDSPKPVLMKVINNSIKTMIMKQRKTMKSSGHRLVDVVTRLNPALITRLNEHPNIDSSWYFNGSVYRKTTAGKINRQTIGILMGTNYAPLVADLFLFCYERDFMKSLSWENQADIIEAFNSTSRYLDDLLNTDNIYFYQMVDRIHPTELQLNTANSSDTDAPFLDLNLHYWYSFHQNL